MSYRSPARDDHLRNEEAQWARVLASGDPIRGMALVTIQKMCTAVHEFQPAAEAGALDPAALDYVRGRMLARIDYALAVMHENGLGFLDGVAQLSRVRNKTDAAADMDSLAGLADELHDVAHTLCDSLEP